MEQLSFNQNLSDGAVALSSVSGETGELAGRLPSERPQSVATRALPSLVSGKRQQAPVREDSAKGNVTEIILPAGQVENMQLLLPMLTQLNQERRWLAWIDPPAELVRKWQQMHGIVTGEILVLRSTETHDGLSLAKRALSAGTCHAVVMWTPGKLRTAAFRSLQAASANGSSHGVILRQR